MAKAPTKSYITAIVAFEALPTPLFPAIYTHASNLSFPLAPSL